MREIYLVRHGETDWNLAGRLQGTEDIPLNNTGILQAEISAGAFKNKNIEIVLSSYLSRAKKTAEIIADKLELALPHIIPDLHERHYGEAAGLTLAERQARFPAGVIVPGREDDASLRERILKAFNYIIQNYNQRKIIIVAHGSLINNYLEYFSKGELGPGKTVIINCSISKILNINGIWEVDYANISAEDLDKYEHKN